MVKQNQKKKRSKGLVSYPMSSQSSSSKSLLEMVEVEVEVATERRIFGVDLRGLPRGEL